MSSPWEGGYGVDHVTIMKEVKKVESGDEQSPPAQPTSIAGTDGKTYPASRPKPDRTAEHVATLEKYPTLKDLLTTEAILQAWSQMRVVQRDTAGMPD
jgi:hypothetical protein